MTPHRCKEIDLLHRMCCTSSVMTSMKRVLSIQSHVVSGYVGNKAATFPLQVLGYDVDAVNSVQFSNHTGYEHIRGQVLQSDELRVLFEGLELNNIHNYSHLLTGYCGSESFLREIINVLKKLRGANPNLVYVCDPVLGDHGKYYVPETLLPIYRDELLPFADVITPNQFEAELLSGITITTESDAMRAISLLHEKGPTTVVLTSCVFGNENELILLAADKKKPKDFVRMEVKKLRTHFTGTGDLFSSMFLAWYHRYPDDLKTSCERTLSALEQILKKTLTHAEQAAGSGKTPSSAQIELRLVDCVDEIRTPGNLIEAQVLKV